MLPETTENGPSIRQEQQHEPSALPSRMYDPALKCMILQACTSRTTWLLAGPPRTEREARREKHKVASYPLATG